MTGFNFVRAATGFAKTDMRNFVWRLALLGEYFWTEKRL